MVKLIFSFCFVISALSSFAQDPNFHIYLCFGQSNMEGAGKIEAKDSIVDDRFQVMQSITCADSAREKGEWYTALPPLCQCHTGLSPADYFGKTMVQALPDSITVGVINVAVGGCDIRLFDKDKYLGHTARFPEEWFLNKIKNYNGNPYKHLIGLAKQAQKDGVIKGILLHQGETNTGDELWPFYVNKIYNDMLVDLSLAEDSIPLLVGELLSIEPNCCSTMNPIINKIPESIPTAHVISSVGCTAMDNSHFDSEGYRKLGRRYAVKMLSLLGY